MSLDENRQFWEQAWVDGRTRFHRPDVNDLLVKYAATVFDAGDKVLVPLCGKSVDLLWLCQQGHGVAGVELAKQAIDEFISENKLQGTWEDQRFQTQASRLSLYHQDFFHHDGRYDVIYDRACLVALTKPLRECMAARYVELLAPEGKILLLTVTHNQEGGPPFSVSKEEVDSLFSEHFAIEELQRYQDGERTITAYILKSA